jgi:glycerol kinase
MKYNLIFDLGTTYVKAFLFDETLAMKAVERRESEAISSDGNFVEQDAGDYFHCSVICANRAITAAGISPKDIAAVGISNQRATTVIWDRDGVPLRNAITWQDGRAATLYEEVYSDAKCRFIDRVGRRGVMTPALALAWIRMHEPMLWEKLASGEAFFGTPDTWLIYKLTGGEKYVVSFSNVGAWGFYDCAADDWHRPIMEQLGIDAAGLLLPQVSEDVGDFGMTAADVFPVRIPIVSVIADQQAEMFANGLAAEGDAKCTLSSGIFVGVNAGKVFRPAPMGMKNQNAWKIDGKATYLFEGQGGMAGSLQQWVKQNFGLCRSYAEISELAAGVSDSGGVLFVPALSGMMAPYWNGSARGSVLGLTRNTTTAHLMRALLEGIAFRVMDILSSSEAETGQRITRLRLGGGMTKSDIFCQILADITGVSAERTDVEDQSVIGAALLTSCGIGMTSNPEARMNDTAALQTTDFKPATDELTRKERYAHWKQVVETVLSLPPFL